MLAVICNPCDDSKQTNSEGVMKINKATPRSFAALEAHYGEGGKAAGQWFHVDSMYDLAHDLHPGMKTPHHLNASMRSKVQRNPRTEGRGNGWWRFIVTAAVAASPTRQSPQPQETMTAMSNITHRQATWTANEIRSLPAIKFNRNVERHGKQLMASGIDRDSHIYATGFATVFIRKLGKTYRLNGNTRTHLDLTDQVALPDIVSGDHYECDTWDEALDLYDKIDNPRNVKQAVDRLFTAMKFHNVHAKAPLFERGGGTSGIAVGWNALHGHESNAAPSDITDVVGELRPHLIAIDGVLAECEVTSNRVATHTAVIAAMLLTHVKVQHGIPKPADRDIAHSDWAEFWCNFHQSKGKLLGTGTSPFNMAWDAVADKMRGGQRKEIFMIGGKLLDCFDRRENDRITSVHKLKMAEYAPVRVEPDMVEGVGKNVENDRPTAKSPDARPTA